MPVIIPLSNRVTPATIIDTALRHLGIIAGGETADGTDADDALYVMRSMLDAWNIDAQATVGFQELTYTPAAASFTIGPAGDVVSRQPSRIVTATYREGVTDWPLEVVTVEEYALYPLKATQTKPVAVALNRDTDTATVYIYPAPDGTSQIRLWVQLDVVESFDTLDLTTTVTLPNGLQNALEWGLAAELGPSYRVSDQILSRAIRNAQNAMRRFKRTNVRVPQLRMPWDYRRDYDVEAGV